MDESDSKHAISGFKFCLDLMKYCANGITENVFVSPFSISVALGMTLAGARQETAEQMKKVLKLDSIGDDTAIHDAYKSAMDSVSTVQGSGVKLRVANRMYVRDTVNLLSEFQEILKNRYSTVSVRADFVTNAEKVRVEINKWVEEVTADKIKDLIAEGVLTIDTCLVLVNAVYFKGDWAQKFDPQNTLSNKFYVDDSKTTDVDLMYKKGKFRFGQDVELGCQILELPYVNENLSMYVILPNEKFGLRKLEEKLTDVNLNKLLSNMGKRKVDVTIPKFKIETSLSLNDILRAMGMRDLFDESKADLSAITGSKDLFVSAVVHKAFLEINEEGSEAAAATAVIAMCYAATFDPTFYVDHPFILFIRDNLTGNVLFWGRISNPS